jgi:hypothetical protein
MSKRLTTLMTQETAKKIAIPALRGVVAFYVISLLICVGAAHAPKSSPIVALGAFWFGGIIGMLVGFFVQEATSWDEKAMAASAAAILGTISSGGGFALLRFADGASTEIWFYPMGLVGGFIIGTIWEWADPPCSSATTATTKIDSPKPDGT